MDDFSALYDFWKCKIDQCMKFTNDLVAYESIGKMRFADLQFPSNNMSEFIILTRTEFPQK